LPSCLRSHAELGLPATLLSLLTLSGCAAIQPTCPPPPTAPPPAPTHSDLAPYLAALDSVSARDPAVGNAALAALRAEREASPSTAATLRYALALGAAARTDSDPVEARRLLDEVLAGPGPDDDARRLAAALRNEFDARIALVAELARERQLAERRRSEDANGLERRIEALAAENQRLRRELTQAQAKLNAIEDIERTLSEQSNEPVEPAP
jgi:hypothetical protein